MIQDLNLLRGRDIKITDGLFLRQPSLGEIADYKIEEQDEGYGEFAYMSMLSTFICTPFDIIAQLDKEGYDFTEITSYQLFIAMREHINVKDTKILFGDFDFSKMRLVVNGNSVELRSDTVTINEAVYQNLADCVRTINSIPPPTFKGVNDEYTKRKMIEYAYDELEFAKRSKPKSILKTMVSRATNHPYFKYNLTDVWDMKVYAFYDAIKSINIVESSNQLSMGAYSGNLDLSKINKNEFNWLREVKD